MLLQQQKSYKMDIKTLNPLLKEYYKQVTGKKALEVVRLPLSGSNRMYFRITGEGKPAIGTFNEDKDENRAFLYLAKHFKKHQVPVPEIFYVDENKGIYLQEDVGDKCLFDIATDPELNEEDKLAAYKKVISEMPSLQYKSAADMDFSYCYPRKAFDRQSIIWDLNYFKYMFLKTTYVPFHEQKLEDEFNKLANFLLEAPSDFFLFRDFKSKNIMWKEDKPVFIDFQGGRMGAVQYDLASLLFESMADLSEDFRNKLINYYIEVFSQFPIFNKEIFLKYFPAFVLIRLLQAFGAYGYRGIFEKKVFFVQSIVPGLKNLAWVQKQKSIKDNFPYLGKVMEEMQKLNSKFSVPDFPDKLTVTIQSFSYRKGIPEDWSGNGGGYVFDCRSLHNPGRYEEYKLFTGMDKEIVDFLEKEEEVGEFISNIKNIIGAAVKKYASRNFTHLAVNFGCTGGRHRSVYSAGQIFNYLKMNFDVNLRLIHRELSITLNENKQSEV